MQTRPMPLSTDNDVIAYLNLRITIYPRIVLQIVDRIALEGEVVLSVDRNKECGSSMLSIEGELDKSNLTFDVDILFTRLSFFKSTCINIGLIGRQRTFENTHTSLLIV